MDNNRKDSKLLKLPKISQETTQRNYITYVVIAILISAILQFKKVMKILLTCQMEEI